MTKSALHVQFEQAVYGTFPFWDRGYGMLTHSAGCRAPWLAELRMVCQRYGEPPGGVPQADALFALPFTSGPWAIVGVHPLGNDDHDRPGALVFHALFVSRWAYWWAGANPFAFAGSIRHHWSAADQDQLLPAGRLTAPRWVPSHPLPFSSDPRLASIATALAGGREVIVRSIAPIDNLARTIWNALPFKVRRRASLATWAFDNANHFNLVGQPMLARGLVDASDFVFAVEPAGC
jgi:hypothetical protein